jgi:cobalamin biosynthesis Mg chelatase CobN
MIEKLIRGALGLFLLGSVLSAAPAQADTTAGPAASASSAVWATDTPSHAFTPNLSMSSPSPSPSGPVDPGTGETKEAKEARVDYAPYVIGAVVLVVLLACFIFWRKRRISHPTKPA